MLLKRDLNAILYDEAKYELSMSIYADAMKSVMKKKPKTTDD